MRKNWIAMRKGQIHSSCVTLFTSPQKKMTIKIPYDNPLNIKELWEAFPFVLRRRSKNLFRPLDFFPSSIIIKTKTVQDAILGSDLKLLSIKEIPKSTFESHRGFWRKETIQSRSVNGRDSQRTKTNTNRLAWRTAFIDKKNTSGNAQVGQAYYRWEKNWRSSKSIDTSQIRRATSSVKVTKEESWTKQEVHILWVAVSCSNGSTPRWKLDYRKSNRYSALLVLHRIMAVKLTCLPQISNGAIPCQLIDALHPGVLPMHKVRPFLNARCEFHW